MKLFYISILFFFITGISNTTWAQNPILPATAFIPDGEPHVFMYKGEKRLFLYGSRDERVTSYCDDGHDVWSAPVNDLTKWTNHGEIFNVKQVWDIGYGIVEKQHFGAPDCVYNPVTKKYYLYTFLGTVYNMDGKQGPLPGLANYVPGFENLGPKCVMAVSDSPAGPFTNPVMCDWPALNKAGTFDPSVLVDEQGDGSIRVFAFWGMVKGDRWAELDPMDMHIIINSETRKPDRDAWHKTLDPKGKTSLFEASSIKKVAKDKYVFIYSANEQHSALTYCYSNSPKGPWAYGGRIVDNSINWNGGNDHGSIVKIGNQWYVFYHRATNNGYSRQAMVEPIDVIIDGDKVVIHSVEMTSQGVKTHGLLAFQRYNAGIVSYRTNNANIDGMARNKDGLNPIIGINKQHTVVGYKYLNFGKQKVADKDKLKLRLNIRMFQHGSISVMVSLPAEANDSSKRVDIATFDLQDYIKADGEYHEITIPITGLNNNLKLKAIGGMKGKLAFFLSFNGMGGELCRFKEFEFAKGNTPTPNPLNEVLIDLNNTKNGRVIALPIKGRSGESIKLSVIPDKGYKIKAINVINKAGKAISVSQNGAAPYAPISFNFSMPADAVSVSTEFVKLDVANTHL